MNRSSWNIRDILPPIAGIIFSCLLLVVAAPSSVAAQAAPPSASAIREDAKAKPDLTFPREAKELSFFSPLAMGIWKPKGEGPFPALIIVHTCGGLSQQISFWRKEAIRRGYVAFVLDSFGPRGGGTCVPTPPASMARTVIDVVQAAEHLATFPFVEKSKIAMVGMSWGGIAGLLIANPDSVPASGVSAVVSLYPICRTRAGADRIPGKSTTPLLVLMGGKDTETPPDSCVAALPRLKEGGAPVEWHVFPDATHCWDCADKNGQRWSPPWAEGRQVIYLYDGKVTDQSAERAFDFLSRHLKVELKK